ncbi:MAG: hypothetical protein F6K42_02450 [Leptolyngbya sp. SIO1D8]|nr:hypothetical protein [Leptolyngbya sp. SIO1D8]
MMSEIESQAINAMVELFEDGEVSAIVTLKDGFKVRFFQQGLTSKEYIRRTVEIQKLEAGNAAAPQDGDKTYNPEDLIEAIDRREEAQRDIETIFADLFNEYMSVYWYRKYQGQWYRQDGFITCVSNAEGQCMEVLNSLTKRKSWLSLYDLRFYLHNTTPEEIKDLGQDPEWQTFLPEATPYLSSKI